MLWISATWLSQRVAALRARLLEARDLRERIARLGEKNARLKSELKRLSVFDKRPGNLIMPLLLERVRLLRQHKSPDAEARASSFAERTPVYARVRNQVQHREPARAQSTSISGLTLWVPDDAGAGSLSTRILTRQWLPLDDIARVRRLVVGGTMLDIGANVGTTAIPRLALGDFSAIYAAEPHPLNYECLVANVVRNGLEGRLLPDRVAITSWNGTGLLEECTHIGGHHLLPHRRSERDTANVSCFTLDAWLRRIGVSPRDVTFVKVDVQGWDAHVLIGAPELRAYRHVVWQVELAPGQMKRAGTDIRLFCRLVQSTFTHVQLLEERESVARPIGDIGRLIEAIDARGRYANVLFFSQSLEGAERPSAQARLSA